MAAAAALCENKLAHAEAHLRGHLKVHPTDATLGFVRPTPRAAQLYALQLHIRTAD